jgi:hypothetical protein
MLRKNCGLNIVKNIITKAGCAFVVFYFPSDNKKQAVKPGRS